MRDAQHDLAGLASLHRLEGDDEIRATWRRGIATLAAVASDKQPVPLEGLDPNQLLASTRLAIARGLADDLAWLSTDHSALAILELATALPRGAEKRELGRRVLRWLEEGSASTFVALATSIALGSEKILHGPAVRARVALALDLPIGAGTQIDALALALVSRPDLSREWLETPAIGSLPSRRLAARLLERAAREAGRRAAEGNDAGVRVFSTPVVRTAWDRLLNDRESLAWRHVAAARGLLAQSVPQFEEEIERGLDPALGPTEWRRAAASLAASIAVQPHFASDRCRDIVAGPIVEKDPGVCGAMIFGLPCAADAESEIAEELLDLLIERGGLYAVEALVDLRQERLGTDFGTRAAEACQERLLMGRASDDDGLVGLANALTTDLFDPAKTVQAAVGAALETFARGSTNDTFSAALHAERTVLDTVSTLEKSDLDTTDGRRRAFRALRDLDRGLLQSATLFDLLAVTRGTTDAPTLASIFERLTRWLLQREAIPVEDGDISHVTVRMRRLQTLLHLVDADGDFGEHSSGQLRGRRLATVRTLCERVRFDKPSRLDRIVRATLARACDAVVREQMAEISDVLLAVSMDVEAAVDLEILGEASMMPDLEALMRAYVEALRLPRDVEPLEAVLRLDELIGALPAASSARVEALRLALLSITRALRSIALAQGVDELPVESSDSAFVKLETGAQWLAQLVIGARRRLGLADPEATPLAGDAIRALESAIARWQSEGVPASDEIAGAVAVTTDELPPAVSEIIRLCVVRIGTLPLTAPDTVEPRPARESVAPQLAPWLPATRMVGGFYVLGPLGAGAGGSVFQACRGDQRHQPRRERFALKVPEYTGSASHTLSEAEFMQLFREEAGALLALPIHRNIARFVTFDAGAKPKPILVMELVEGPSLLRVLEKEELDTKDKLSVLDGLAAGLLAMHEVGVAHLDIKPSNIIIRGGNPVLVDFGLAGRKLRPGCATVYYGAPEVWSGGTGSPLSADVYAYACLVYEVLCGRPLFDEDTAVAFITAHGLHDGSPPGITRLRDDPDLAGLGELLATGLRRAPHERATIQQLRDGLQSLNLA